MNTLRKFSVKSNNKCDHRKIGFEKKKKKKEKEKEKKPDEMKTKIESCRLKLKQRFQNG